MHHSKSDVARLNIPRNKGGRGQMQLELCYKTTTIGLYNYLAKTKDWMLKLTLNLESSEKSHSVVKESMKFKREFDIEFDYHQLEAIEVARKVKKNVKLEGLKQLQERWHNKPFHVQFAARVNNADVDKKATYQWLISSRLKPETEGFIIAVQDQSLFTKNYQANIMHNGKEAKCRFCADKVETIDHLVSGCSILTPRGYKTRHDRVGQYLHWKIFNHFLLDTTKNWYEHKPEAVTKGPGFTTLWNFPIHTDRTIQANRPDIVVKDKQGKTCYLIDMSVPSDKNVAAKVFDKMSKYKDLEIEVSKMWKLKVKTIHVVVGALGLVKKGTEELINMIPGNSFLREVQKIVLTSTAHVLRRALSI